MTQFDSLPPEETVPAVPILPIDVPDPEKQAASARLMKKARRQLIVFFVCTLLAMILVSAHQGERLFLFDLSNQNVNDTQVSRVFSFLTYVILISTTVTFVLFAGQYIRRSRIKNPQTLETERRRFERQYGWFDMISVIPVFLLLMVFVNAYFISPAVVDGRSMEPTFFDDDPVLIYHFNIRYQREDIVIVDMTDRLLIKRLVALPGDTLVVSLGGVFVNGNLIEPDVRGAIIPYNGIVPEGSYFVMGDNRTYTSQGTAMSHDSRYFGFLSEAQLLGKVIVKFNV
jgi:signal peptidase I